MATNQVSEQEIQFRKRARRRLVGAVALVLLMVTVLPMVLDDRESKSPRPDISISIPSQDGGDFTSRIVPVAPGSPTSQATPVTPPAANVQPLASPLEQPKPVAEPVKKPAPVAVKPEATPPVPVSKPQQSTSKPDEPPVKPAEPAATPKPAPVKSPTDTAAKPAANKGSLSVQIGVFTDGPQLQQLESKLAAKGFHPSHEKIDTPKGVKTRLRLGPYATRADAELALGKLKSADVAGMIVTNK